MFISNPICCLFPPWSTINKWPDGPNSINVDPKRWQWQQQQQQGLFIVGFVYLFGRAEDQQSISSTVEPVPLAHTGETGFPGLLQAFPVYLGNSEDRQKWVSLLSDPPLPTLCAFPHCSSLSSKRSTKPAVFYNLGSSSTHASPWVQRG